MATRHQPKDVKFEKAEEIYRRLDGLEVDMNIHFNQRSDKWTKKDRDEFYVLRSTVQSIKNDLYIASHGPLAISEEITKIMGRKLYDGTH